MITNKDKRMTIFFKFFIIIFGIHFACFLLYMSADSGLNRHFAEIGGSGLATFFFFCAFSVFVRDMISLFVSLKYHPVSQLDRASKNSLLFYFLPCVLFVCLVILGGAILFLFG